MRGARRELTVGPAGAALALDLSEALGHLRNDLVTIDPQPLRR
ncbi:MAG: hypothetical protein WD382_00305 [Halofilum sp. (in: g-proteobacteria)]